jgi:hypothetical protein
MKFNLRSGRFTLGVITFAAISLSSVHSISSQSEQPAVAHKYIATEKEIKTLHGNAYRTTANGRIILEGDVDLPASHQLPEVSLPGSQSKTSRTRRQALELFRQTASLSQPLAWMACIRPNGQLDWSVRVPDERDAESMFALTSDGDSIWCRGSRKDGIFRLAKFDAKTLRKESSVQIGFEPTTPSKPSSGLHLDTDRDFDFQVSAIQPVHNTVQLALFSRDLRLLFDKRYVFSFLSDGKQTDILQGAYLIRLPDRSGYYLCFRHPISAEGHSSPGVGILRLDNSGAIKWANTYSIGYSEFEVEPHMATDGAILVQFLASPNSKDSFMLKIGPDGTINWAERFPGLPGVDVANASFGSTPHRFIEPHLYATSGQLASAKLYSILLALNYKTGQVEKQIKFTSPGGALYTEKTNDSLYVTLLNMNYAGGRVASQAALLRFDLDLNFRAARSVRNAEPHWPIFRALPSGKFLFSYSYHDKKALVVETMNENFDGAKSCDVLQSANFSFTKTNFEARPFTATTTPLAGIDVSEANSKISEADLSLVPLDLKAVPCRDQP